MDEILAAFEQAATRPLAYARDWKQSNEGRVIGIFPMHFPGELAHAAGALPIVLQEDQEPITVGLGSLFSFYCGYNRSIVDQALRGEFGFLDAIMFGDHCVQLLGTADILRDRSPELPILFNQLITSLSAPWAEEETRRAFAQLWKELEALVGHIISPEDVRESIRLFNRNRALIRQIYQLRREGRIFLSGRSLQLIVKSGMTMETRAHTALLEAFLAKAEIHPPAPRGVRVYLSGHLCQAPKPEILDLIEECGGVVVDDDLYHGYRFVATDIDETGDPLDALARWHLERNKRVPCPTVSDETADLDRFLLGAVERSKAQGLIILQVKYCEPHMFFYPEIKETFEREGVPHLLIETEHEQMPMEALKTRLETFMEIVKRRAARSVPSLQH
jgi:benzoyl-CoA reductase subunit C